MKKTTKKVTQKQFSKWSLPSQLSFLNYNRLKKMGRMGKLSLLIGGLSLCIGIYTLFLKENIKSSLQQKSANKISSILKEYENAKDWFAHGATVEKVDHDYWNEDWYNYHRILSNWKSNSTISSSRSSEYYFKKINPASQYFGKSIRLLIEVYEFYYDEIEFHKKMSSLIQYLDVIDYKEPEYFLLHLMSIKYNSTGKDIIAIYMNIRNTYPELFLKPAGSFSFHINKIGLSREINFDRLSKLYGISFMCAYVLHENKMADIDIFKDIKRMFPTTKEYNFAEMGMSKLSLQMSEENREQYKSFIMNL